MPSAGEIRNYQLKFPTNRKKWIHELQLDIVQYFQALWNTQQMSTNSDYFIVQMFWDQLKSPLYILYHSNLLILTGFTFDNLLG